MGNVEVGLKRQLEACLARSGGESASFSITVMFFRGMPPNTLLACSVGMGGGSLVGEGGRDGEGSREEGMEKGGGGGKAEWEKEGRGSRESHL